MAIDENFINSLSNEQLRSELRHALEVQYGVLFALRKAPEFPPAFVLSQLGSVAKYPNDYNRGKELQRDHGLDVIPPVTECEMGAGLWDRIRKGLVSPPAIESHPGKEEIAREIWLSEYRRATGKERSIDWHDVSDEDRARYRFIADDILSLKTSPRRVA